MLRLAATATTTIRIKCHPNDDDHHLYNEHVGNDGNDDNGNHVDHDGHVVWFWW